MKLGLVGKNVETSLAPKIFECLSLETGIELTYDILAEFDIKTLIEKKYDGVSVTIPFKEKALEVSDVKDFEVTYTGASNLLKFSDKVYAYNTDTFAIESVLKNHDSGTSALVLGAGGAGRSAVWVLRKLGWQVYVWNRSPEGAMKIQKDFSGVSLYENEPIDLLVNATPSQDILSFLDHLNQDGVVFDMNFEPKVTPLLSEAAKRKYKTISGRDMLVWQALAAFQIWTGRDVWNLKERVDAFIDHV